jgi:hypothetical protein
VIVLLPAGLAALGAAAIAIAGLAGGWMIVAACGLSVLALGIGWGDLLRLPHRSGTAVLVGGLGGASLVAGKLAVDPVSGLSRPLGVFAAVIAAGVLTSFAHELLRRDGRPDVVESVTGTFSGQVVAVLASGWVLLAQTTEGSSAIIVATAALAAARLGSALPLPLSDRLRSWLGVGYGLVAALLASMFVSAVRPLTAVAVGVAVSAVGVAIDRLFPVSESRLDLSVLARASAPVAAAGTVAYAVLRIGVG